MLAGMEESVSVAEKWSRMIRSAGDGSLEFEVRFESVRLGNERSFLRGCRLSLRQSRLGGIGSWLRSFRRLYSWHGVCDSGLATLTLLVDDLLQLH